MMPAIYGNSYPQIVRGQLCDPARDGATRRASSRWITGRACATTSSSTWATPAAISKATRSSSKRRTSGSARRRSAEASSHLKLTERFKPMGPKAVEEWSVSGRRPAHVDAALDTFADDADARRPISPSSVRAYEGNHGLYGILSAAAGGSGTRRTPRGEAGRAARCRTRT